MNVTDKEVRAYQVLVDATNEQSSYTVPLKVGYICEISVKYVKRGTIPQEPIREVYRSMEQRPPAGKSIFDFD